MNRILSLIVLLALTTMAQAQSPYLPYNPDENADGLIGVADLQGLLSAYGSEFSSAILSDNGNIAVVEVGDMDYYRCRSACASLPGAWSLVNENSVGLILDELVGGYAWFETLNAANTNTKYTVDGIANRYITDPAINKRCFCHAKQRPRVEYSYCSGGEPSEEAFNQCISEKLSQGWYPLSGFPMEHSRQAGGTSAFYNGTSFDSQTHASFWRWEQ